MIQRVPTYYRLKMPGTLARENRLTGDPDWSEGGKLLKKYDLKLDSRTGDKVYKGVREVSVTGIDTYDDSEAIENVNDSDDDVGGVRVSGPDLEMDENNLEPDVESDIPVTNTPLVIFEGMEECTLWLHKK